MYYNFVIKKNLIWSLFLVFTLLFMPVFVLSGWFALGSRLSLFSAIWVINGTLIYISQINLVREYFQKGIIDTKKYNQRSFLTKLGLKNSILQKIK